MSMSHVLRSGADSRATEILDSIMGTFARRGLEGASMQDLAHAAGMSVGNFYRYFPSKIALIVALVERCADDVRQGFSAAQADPDPMGAMRRLLCWFLRETSEDETALWLQIDAAALLHPEIAAVKKSMDEAIRADVRAMVGAVPQAAGVPEGRLEDLTDMMMLFSASLFRQRAFESGPGFLPKAERLTTQFFDMIERELVRSAAKEQAA